MSLVPLGQENSFVWSHLSRCVDAISKFIKFNNLLQLSLFATWSSRNHVAQNIRPGEQLCKIKSDPSLIIILLYSISNILPTVYGLLGTLLPWMVGCKNGSGGIIYCYLSRYVVSIRFLRPYQPFTVINACSVLLKPESYFSRN